MYLFIDSRKTFSLVAFAQFDHTKTSGSVGVNKMLGNIPWKITCESNVIFVLLK